MAHLIQCPWCMGEGMFKLHYSLGRELCPTCEGKGIIDLEPPVPHKLTVTTIIHEEPA